MKPTWVLVADSSRVRFFYVGDSSALEEVEVFLHSESRMHEQDLVSDQQPGRIVGNTGAHAYQGHISPKEQEVINFARDIAQHLENAYHANKFDCLMIIAEPSFLGELRKQLSEQVQKIVSFELDKNITEHSVEDIRAHLPKHLV